MTVLCALSDLRDSATGMLRVVPDGWPEGLVLCLVGEEVHAIAALCSHGRSDLADGRLIGCEVECELHQGRFNVVTGTATRRPAKRPIATYSVRIIDGLVVVDDRLNDNYQDSEGVEHGSDSQIGVDAEG